MGNNSASDAPPTSPKGEVVLLLTHRSDEATLDLHRELTETSGGRPVIFLYHGEPHEGLPQPAHCFSDKDLLRAGYRTIESPFLMFAHTNFPVLDFASRHSAADRFWVIEYDVRFTGDWRVLFDHFRDSRADLLTCCVGEYAPEDPEWPWWELTHPRQAIPKEERLRSFNPIYRISRPAVECLERELASGWAGHQEVAMPTLLRRNGLELEDMGGDGPYVRGTKNRFYTSGPGRNLPFRETADRSGAFKSGTMRFRPVRRRPGLRRHCLYHPVKPHPEGGGPRLLNDLKGVWLRPARRVVNGVWLQPVRRAVKGLVGAGLVPQEPGNRQERPTETVSPAGRVPDRGSSVFPARPARFGAGSEP